MFSRLPTVYSVVFVCALIAAHAVAGDRQEETITHADLFVIKAEVRSEKDTIRNELSDMTEGIRQTVLVELTNNTDSDWHDIHGIGSCSCIGGRDLDGKSCAIGETIRFELKLKPTQDAYRQAFELRRRDDEGNMQRCCMIRVTAKVQPPIRLSHDRLVFEEIGQERILELNPSRVDLSINSSDVHLTSDAIEVFRIEVIEQGGVRLHLKSVKDAASFQHTSLIVPFRMAGEESELSVTLPLQVAGLGRVEVSPSMLNMRVSDEKLSAFCLIEDKRGLAAEETGRYAYALSREGESKELDTENVAPQRLSSHKVAIKLSVAKTLLSDHQDSWRLEIRDAHGGPVLAEASLLLPGGN